MSREYSFVLPVPSGLIEGQDFASALRSSPELAAAVARCPDPVALKLRAIGPFRSVTLTRHDLDEIPDDAWGPIATALGLAWRPA